MDDTLKWLLERLDLGIGDTVLLKRAAEAIPKTTKKV